MKSLATILLLCMCAGRAGAQGSGENLQGNWKFLGGYEFVHVDDEDRVFQCRIDLNMNVFFATANIQADGVIEWGVPRFFSIYGKEVASGQVWGDAKIELKGRIMFLEANGAPGRSIDRREFDKVPELPTICDHYLALAFE